MHLLHFASQLGGIASNVNYTGKRSLDWCNKSPARNARDYAF